MLLSEYREHKEFFIKRIFWIIIRVTVFRLLVFPRWYFARNSLLRLFGADIPIHCMIYSSCVIFAPWNLKVGKHTCLGPQSIIYNKTKVEIGANSVISQGAFLCTASHDITSLKLPLQCGEIKIGDSAWVAADAFIGMGVTVGDGAVVGARACVFKDVAPWTVVGGNPAKFIKKREIVS